MEQIIYSKIQNLRIFTQVKGEGEPLLLLHGWGASPISYQKLINMLSKKFLVYAPHMPAFGYSQKLNKQISFENYFEVIAELFLTFRELDFIGVGHSFGGAVLTQLALRHSKKFKKIYLINTAGHPLPERTFKEWVERFKKQSTKNIKNVYQQGFLRTVLKDVFLTTLRLKDVYKLARMIMKLDLRRDFSKIKVPTYILWGENDLTFPLEIGKQVHKLIPKSHLKVIRGSDHIWCVTDPQELVKIL